MQQSPLVLLILDGFGYRKEREDNAIAQAEVPFLQKIWQDYPHSLLAASGLAVGLPESQMGNSEVGHMNIGAGRILTQELTKIDAAIESGEFAEHPLLKATFADLRSSGRSLHIMGLLSEGGVHSHEAQIHAMLKAAAAQGVTKVYLHAILDGRDCPPKSAESSLGKLTALCQHLGLGKIATVIGRYFAMDRDQRWERIEAAYRLYTEGQARYRAANALDALAQAYAAGETDEFVQAALIDVQGLIQAEDTVIFMNFRADRARQITRAFTQKEFTYFKRPVVLPPAQWISLTQYDASFESPVLYPPANVKNTLGEILSAQGLRQLRIAETEKYAHVTFFFNGGVEAPFPLETRELIPSPKVATYDLQPEMSANLLTEKLVAAILSGNYEVLIANFANADMVGHTGNFAAAVKAIEALDACLRKIAAACEQRGGELLITADHGNADCMYDHEAHQVHTAHTHSPVPFIYVGPRSFHAHDGALSDIAPTMLMLLGLSQPTEMTGESLLDNS